jgi:hypothetical protein
MSFRLLQFIVRCMPAGKGHLQPADDDAAGWAQFLNWMFRAGAVVLLPLPTCRLKLWQ